MATIKKSDSSIYVVFKDSGHYTNKLFARNIRLESGKLEIDYSHYSKRKRKNLEDSDFMKLMDNYNNISHLVVSDDTVRKTLEKSTFTEVALKLNDSISPVFPVLGYEKNPGFIRLRF